MKKQWQAVKNIIDSNNWGKNLFLSLIDEEGTIFSANAGMKRALHLQDPRTKKTNLFDLLHPLSTEEIKKAISHCGTNKKSFSTELYLKNGYYHPMKWQINFLEETAEKKKTYLCAGYKLMDDERLREFNRLGESNYQLIVEVLHTGILFQDKKGELIAVNHKAAEIFGASMERLYQLKNIHDLWNTVWTVTNEEGQPVLFENTPFMKALKTGKPHQEVLIIKLRSGENRWISFSSQPLFEQNPDIAYSVVSSVTDITQERLLVSEISERKAVFKAFMDNTPNLAWVVDEEGTLIFASHSFYQYFGIDERESANRKMVDVIPANVAKALYDKHVQVLESGQPTEVVEKVEWADGTNFVFHINIFPINAITGKKLLGGHAVNLADKYAAERKLREANDRLLLLSRATTNAIWEWDMQTGYIFRNDALMDMIGYQMEETKGLSWWLRRIHPEDRNRVSDKVKDTTEKNLHSWEDQYRFKCADGTYKHMHDKGFVVYENGLPVKMIGSLQDMTELKELEEQLTEEKLQRQKEISETVIRVQEKERTRIGHELHDNVNQILSTVRLFVDMLTPSKKEEKEIKAKSLEYVMMAIEEIRKLSKELVAPQLIGNGLVKSVEALVSDIELSGTIKINFSYDNERYPLSPGKELTFFRIVQEQLKNILKYSKASQADIILQCNESNVELLIRDNGVGFDSKQTHRGIGLSNIYERTRFYNGSVDIQTAPGKGCLLTVNLPLL